jgi:hypothetical protein
LEFFLIPSRKPYLVPFIYSIVLVERMLGPYNSKSKKEREML